MDHVYEGPCGGLIRYRAILMRVRDLENGRLYVIVYDTILSDFR